MRQEKSLADLDKELQDTTRVVDNGGHTHLAGALEEDAELYFRNGEDADGDPQHSANVNSLAYNPFLDNNGEPIIDGSGKVVPTTLDEIADLLPESERPKE